MDRRRRKCISSSRCRAASGPVRAVPAERRRSVQCSGMNRAAKGPAAYPAVLGLTASSPALDVRSSPTVVPHDRRDP